GEYSELRARAWLPVEGSPGSWKRPSEVSSTFQQYLFASQAEFVGLPLRIQQQSVGLFEALGTYSTPTTSQVVSHLLHCAERGLSVNLEVYRFLSDHHGDDAINRLKDRSCIAIAGQYVHPRDVYWE